MTRASRTNHHVDGIDGNAFKKRFNGFAGLIVLRVKAEPIIGTLVKGKLAFRFQYGRIAGMVNSATSVRQPEVIQREAIGD